MRRREDEPLRSDDLRRVRAVERELRELWPDVTLLPRVAELVRDAFDGEQAVLAYLRPPGNAFSAVGHTFAKPFDQWASIRNIQTLPGHIRYSLTEREVFAGRPVDERALFAGDRDGLAHYRADFLAPNDLWFQLRTSLYEGNDFAGLFGLLRPKDAGPFGRGDARRSSALTPAVAEWMQVARLLHAVADDAALVTVLDALDEPVFLATRKGVPVHANHAAKRAHRSPPEWLAAVARQGPGHGPLAKVAPVRIAGSELLLVRQQDAGSGPQPLSSLPPYLVPTATLMARGLSDKEIACALDASLATVRTYAHRVLRLLEMSSRRELMLCYGVQSDAGSDP